MSTPVLACDQIEYADQGPPLFAGVTLHLEPGERVVLLADPHHHGTILLKICATLISPTGGEISWFGRSHSEIQDAERYQLRRRISLVYRESSLVSNMTILDNVTIGLQYHENLGRDAAYRRALALMERFGLAEHRFLRPAALNPEERRLVVYARELLKRPDIVLLESPFFDLHEGYQHLLMEAVEEARSGWGCALLVGNVEPAAAQSWGERVHILQGGRSFSLPAREFDPVLYAASVRKRAENLFGARSMV